MSTDSVSDYSLFGLTPIGVSLLLFSAAIGLVFGISSLWRARTVRVSPLYFAVAGLPSLVGIAFGLHGWALRLAYLGQSDPRPLATAMGFLTFSGLGAFFSLALFSLGFIAAGISHFFPNAKRA